jgi:3D (Asp-Asp-Asp) domain-containing protein
MAFTGNYVCSSFKIELLKAVHDFTASTGDTFKMSLYTSSASMTAAQTAYTATAEVSGTGYTATGMNLTNVTPVAAVSPITTAVVDFNPDPTWSASSITARGALIYNDTASGDPAVVVLDFGSDKTSASGDFTVMFPAADGSNAIIRIA